MLYMYSILARMKIRKAAAASVHGSAQRKIAVAKRKEGEKQRPEGGPQGGFFVNIFC